jgi:hypothetical protein
MQVNANRAFEPQRFQRVFKKMTRIMIQIRGAQTVVIGRDQGEVTPQGTTYPDGIQLTQTSTATPFTDWWVGELWFSSNVASTGFIILIIGEAGE